MRFVLVESGMVGCSSLTTVTSACPSRVGLQQSQKLPKFNREAIILATFLIFNYSFAEYLKASQVSRCTIPVSTVFQHYSAWSIWILQLSSALWPQISIYGHEKRNLEWRMWVKVTLGTTQSHLDLKLLLWGLEDQVSGWSRRSESQSGGVKKNQHNTSQNNTRTRSWLGILIFVSVVSGGMAKIAWYCFSQIFVKNWPQVLQKNIGVFSFRSQLAQEGNSSEEDSTWWTIDHLVCYTFGSKSNPLGFTKTKDDLIFELIFTRKRSSESVGGTVWPSLSEVTFLNRNVSKVNSLKK